MLSSRRAVISGVGILAANGIGKDAFWDSLLSGVTGIGPVTQFDASGLPCRIAGEIKGFDPSKYVGRRLKPKRLGRFSQLAIAAVGMALEDAGLGLPEVQRIRMLPVVLGVSTSAMDLIARDPTIHTVPAAIPHAAGSSITAELELDTRLLTTSSACASSMDAISLAASMIRRGESEIAIAGGSDSAVARYVFEAIGKTGMLSGRNDHPEKASRPFERDRDGGVIAEAAGIVIVENYERALARGVIPYCEIGGYGSTADPVGEPELSGMEGAIRLALSSASRPPDFVDAVSAHGPSDKYLDRMETEVIKRVLGSRAYRIPVSSVKGTTGNPFGTAGAVQVIAAALSIRHETIPPTINMENPDPDCDLDYVPNEPRVCITRSILVDSHGVGRVNSSMLLERLDS